jgi:hypothetical protein
MEQAETVLIALAVPPSDPHLWIADSGASCHMTGTLTGLTNMRDDNTPVRFGQGHEVKTTKVGTWTGQVVHADGTTHPLTLLNVKYVPRLPLNLFSIVTAMRQGGQFGNVGTTMITFTKGAVTIKFDQKISTHGGGHLCAVLMKPTSEIASPVLQLGSKVSATKLHGVLGHSNDGYMRYTAKAMGIDVTGQLHRCKNCAIG